MWINLLVVSILTGILTVCSIRALSNKYKSMARVAPKVSKPLSKAMFHHRVDPKKYPAANIIQKFGLKDHNTFYRMYYHAAQQQA